MSGFVLAGQSLFDAYAVHGDVLVYFLSESFGTGDDVLPTTVCPHGSSGEVGVATRTVPVAQHGLGFERGEHAKVLGDAEEQPAGNPQLVGDFQRRQGANLELPLRHHDFGIGSFDGQTGSDARSGVGLDDVTTRHTVATDAAVVRTLRCGVTVLGPAVWSTVLNEGVLLLEAKDRLHGGVLLGNRCQL